jgi:hypothetical protein
VQNSTRSTKKIENNFHHAKPNPFSLLNPNINQSEYTLFFLFKEKSYQLLQQPENLCSFKRSSRSLMIVKEGVCHTLHMALPYKLFKKYLKHATEELWKFKYFTHAKKI